MLPKCDAASSESLEANRLCMVSAVQRVAPLPAQRRGLAVPARPVHPDRDRARARARRRASSIFVASALGVIPTAALMGRATEELAARSGPGIGGFLNVTFGNAPELIIAFFALRRGAAGGRQGVAGRLDPRQHPARDGRRDARRRPQARAPDVRPHGRQRAVARCCCSPCVALIMPAIFELVIGGGLPQPDATSPSTSAPTSRRCRSAWRSSCCGTYVAGLVFSLRTHQRPLQPRARRGRPRRRAVDGAQRSVIAAGGRRRGGRRDVGDPRRLDHRGVGGDRAVAVLRRRDRGGDRRQRRRALGGGLLRLARQDGPVGQHRDRLERADRAVRRARAGAALVRRRRRSRWRWSSTASSWARSCSRC